MVVEGRKGGQQVPRYEAYLQTTRDELIEAITEAENAGWHHQPSGDFRAAAYNRLLTWYEAIRQRIVWWNAVQSDSTLEGSPPRLIPEPRTAPRDPVEGPDHQPDPDVDKLLSG